MVVWYDGREEFQPFVDELRGGPREAVAPWRWTSEARWRTLRNTPEHYVREYERLVMGGVWVQIDPTIVEHVDPIFFGEPKTAAMKALGF